MPLTKAEERERWDRQLAVERGVRREHLSARLYSVFAAVASILGFMAVGALWLMHHLGGDVPAGVIGLVAVASSMSLMSAHIVARDGGF